jgi:hypothetical protein
VSKNTDGQIAFPGFGGLNGQYDSNDNEKCSYYRVKINPLIEKRSYLDRFISKKIDNPTTWMYYKPIMKCYISNGT